MLEKKKLRDIAESISGIRPENRSLEGIVSFIEEQANIVYEKQPKTFLGRLRELGYALNGVRPSQRSLRGIVNNIYENFNPEPPTSDKIYGVSGMFSQVTSLTRTDDAVGMTYTKNLDGTITSDFDDVFPYNEMKKETINGNVFVKIPAMWFRVGVDSDKNITDIAVSQSKGEGDNWYQTKEFYYGAYLGTISENYNPSTQQNVYTLDSKSGYTPANNSDIYNFRIKAQNNNGIWGKSGYQILDIYHKTILNFLFLIEFANKDSSSLFPMTYDELQECGGTDNIETPSGVLENGRLKWHYIEDFFGNLLEFTDGVISNKQIYYFTTNPSNYGEYYSYTEFSIQKTMDGFCIASFGWDSNNPFICVPQILIDNSNYDTYFADRSVADDRYDHQVCETGGLSYGILTDGEYGVFSTEFSQYDSRSTATGTRLLYCPNGV